MSTDAEAWARLEQAAAIDRAMRACPGWGLQRDVWAVDDIERILRGNHREAQSLMSIVEDPARWFPLIDVRNRGALGQLMNELDRLLHNYLASAYSLSSCLHGIAKRRGWMGGPLGREFLQTTPFKRPGLPSFMFGLRNAVQHERIPVTTGRDKGWRDESDQFVMESFFTLDLKALRALDWLRPSLGYDHLMVLREDPRVDVLVDSFTTELLEFSDWFKNRFRRAYDNDLLELEALSAQLTSLTQPFREANDPGPPTIEV